MASLSPPDGTNTCSPDPRPRKRHKASRKEWQEIRAQFESACCVSCGLRATLLHHIAFKKADRGDDVAENLAPMCDTCHGRFHRREERWEQVAAHIRAYVLAKQSRYNYVLGKLGAELFNRRYPSPAWLALGDLDRYRFPDRSLSEPEEEMGADTPTELAGLPGSESDYIVGHKLRWQR